MGKISLKWEKYPSNIIQISGAARDVPSYLPTWEILRQSWEGILTAVIILWICSKWKWFWIQARPPRMNWANSPWRHLCHFPTQHFRFLSPTSIFLLKITSSEKGIQQQHCSSLDTNGRVVSSLQTVLTCSHLVCYHSLPSFLYFPRCLLKPCHMPSSSFTQAGSTTELDCIFRVSSRSLQFWVILRPTKTAGGKTAGAADPCQVPEQPEEERGIPQLWSHNSSTAKVAKNFYWNWFLYQQMIETIGRQLEDVVLGQRLFSDIEVNGHISFPFPA